MDDDRKVQLLALRWALANLPGLCAPPDGLIYAGDVHGIRAYERLQDRLTAALEQEIFLMELLDE